ncbi:S1-C subfamily serine protease [Saccharothrix coeruleofusca]|uniref:S1C family serine protease n=1 Tax=Saccharothrix coeruleofusca TaxID=33919 RepID=UPI0027DD8E11|nr:trypsin-like peptidase domain-containing protein [Saccharothrix coeruleofusca]MBP2334816.1 S1-C subfamily serine protease [Saccharothrix coeruleofusca]
MALNRMAAAAALVVATAACTTGPGGTGPGGTTSSSTSVPATAAAESSYADLVERVAPHVVTIRTDGGLGSGVVFRSDVVVTNQHVVGGRKGVMVEYADGERSSGEVLATDEITDLAVVRTERKDLPVPEYREDLPRPGDVVLAIGSPLGFENTVTAGIVSGLHREIPGTTARTQALVDLIQTDAPISPGNSGGALLDTAGRVVGINEAYIPPAAGAVSLGFAIPSSTAVDVAGQLLDDGTATHPYLGVSLGRLTEGIRERLGVEADQGALVLRLDESGPAAGAGVRPGDVIVGLAGQDVRGVEDVLGALRGTEPGQRIGLVVVRDGQRQELEVEVAARGR